MVLAASNPKMNGFGMMLPVCESLVFLASSLLLYICLFYCVPGITFSPDQLKGGWVWNCHRRDDPMQRKGSVFTPLEAAAYYTIYTHPLSV